MRTHRRRRYVTAVLAALSVSLGGPTAALAVPADAASTTTSSSAQSGAKVGDTPAEFGKTRAVVTPTPAKVGDTPQDFPGASRAPEYNPPTTIEVVRPERTIVRDTDPALPIVLGGLALLVALGTAGAAMRHGRQPNLSRTA
jgi:hypothetical protein